MTSMNTINTSRVDHQPTLTLLVKDLCISPCCLEFDFCAVDHLPQLEEGVGQAVRQAYGCSFRELRPTGKGRKGAFCKPIPIKLERE